MMNVAEILGQISKQYPQKPALIFHGQSVTFSQLKDSVFKFASSLNKLGIKRQDKVVIYLPNCREYIYSYLALWSIGATAVPLDFMLTEDEIISCARHSEAVAFIARSKPAISIERIKSECPQLKEIIICNEEAGGYLNFEKLIEGAQAKFDFMDVPDKEYSAIFYTSGTTGKPKGVLTNYRQLKAPAEAMSYFVDLSHKDTALCALPLSHLGGLVFIQGILFLGLTVVLMDRFIPLEFLRNIPDYKITCFWLVPPMYYAILQLKEFESFDFSTLRFICVFGASSSIEQIRRFHQYCFNAELYHGWGMTETQGPTVVTPKGSQKMESVGQSAPWFEIKIFDNQDREVAKGGTGELVVRGWAVSDGYYKNNEATQQAWRNRWFHTGDLARFDEEKNLYIVGRNKEMIKVAGEIVFEPEVEAAIHRHPDIAEAAVVGVADKLRGEVPKAYVVLRAPELLNADSLRNFLKNHLAHFKIPHYFEFVEFLPKNRAGKIDKEQLRKANEPRPS